MQITIKLFITRSFWLWLLLIPFVVKAQVKQPYKKLHGGSFSSQKNPASPDPLVNYQWLNTDAAQALQYFVAKPITAQTFPSSAASVINNEWLIRSDVDIMFDFGVEHAAWPEFDSKELSGDVEMSISEYNEPAIVNEGAQHPAKTLKPVRYGNTFRLELNDELYEGVRFVWLHFKNVKKPFHVNNIRLICQVKPANYSGSFHTNDSMLNRLWYTGAYTVRLNFMKDYIGAILMERSDRHSWTGDAYPAQAASLVAFGNYDLVKKNLAYTAKLDNSIPAYALYWVLSLADYFNYTADTAFLKKYLNNAEEKLTTAKQYFDSLPNVAFLGWDERLGAGFENPNLPEGRLVYRCLCLQAWQSFAATAIAAGYTGIAKRYTSFAKEKMQWLIKNNSQPFGLHSVAKAVNAGLLSDSIVAQAAGSFFSNRLQRLSYSPFNQFFILQAMAKAGYMNEALTTVKDCWGGQIENGGTTFFEVYRPSWNNILQSNDAPPNNQCGYTSLAHPWSAGVTMWLTENILGVHATAPGFKEFEIKPFLNQNIHTVSGSVPTPHGIINVSFDMNLGECTLQVPRGTKASVSIPVTGLKVISVLLNGQTVQVKRASAIGQNYISFPVLQAGKYTIKINFTGTLIKPKEENTISYPVHAYSVDSLTAGNWKNYYGKDGYMLLGLTRADKKKLPSYIDSVVLNKNVIEIWDTVSVNTNALEPVSGRNRLAAAIVTQSPRACYQTMTVDVNVHTNKYYRLSLYFLDWDDKSRRSAVEIFDLNTLELLSPEILIKNYKGGKYLSVQCTGPVRIRINDVRGKNAAISGLFFDSF